MVIGIALIWVAFYSMNTVPKWLDFKPFNCVICASFWSCLLACITRLVVPETEPYINALGWAGVGAYVGMVAMRLAFRI